MNILNSLAKERGAPATFIAERLNIPAETVRRHLRGETTPSADAILAYANFFGVEVSTLISQIYKNEKR